MRWIAITCLMLGCAQDVRVHFPAAPGAPTGTLVLQMSQAASDVTVAVNGILVVDDQHTGHVVIEGIPVGTAEVMMAANGADKEFRAWVGGDHATTVPLGVPDPTMGFLKTILGTVLTLVVYSLLHPGSIL